MEMVCKRRKGNENNRIQETKEEKDETSADRLSSLPDHLNHHILSLLSIEDVWSMSLLSKRWNMLFTTFPIIDLNEDNYPSREKFVEALQLCLVRRQMVHLQKLSVQMTFPSNGEIDQLIDKILDEATKGNVQALDLRFSNGKYRSCWNTLYVLPEVIFSHCSSMKSFEVVGINLGYSYKVLNLPFLRTLSIKNALIGDEFLPKLINACPSLENLSLMRCLGLKIAKIHHNKISYFLVKCNRLLEKIEIDLPNLQRFFYKGPYLMNRAGVLVASMVGNEHEATKLDTVSLKHSRLEFKAFQDPYFKYLGTLILSDIEIVDGSFWCTNAFFPHLVSLELKCCKTLRKLHVISSTVKCLVICNCKYMDYWKIVCTNLLVLEYEGPVVKFSRPLTSNKVEVKLSLRTRFIHSHDILELHRTRDFLQMFSSAGDMTMTLIHDCEECVMMLKEVAELPLNYVKHLEVKTDEVSINLIDLFQGILSISVRFGTLLVHVDSLQIKLKLWDVDKKKASSGYNMQQANYEYALQSLQNVWITNFGGSDEEIKLVDYVLKKAINLECISVSPIAADQEN
ncbi:putative F-box/FBD/LRR-repeat protein At1g78840 [Coffea eugenioides]|nr:putative F-box/FBD/LRR-repeat protein At1g78840 [Coffea eugenioides]